VVMAATSVVWSSQHRLVEPEENHHYCYSILTLFLLLFSINLSSEMMEVSSTSSQLLPQKETEGRSDRPCRLEKNDHIIGRTGHFELSDI
jgi:hypothetical protein